MKYRPTIVFESETFVIVNKPQHFLSIPHRFDQTQPSVLGFLRKRYEEVLIVHRIDKETSGIMVFALTKEAHRNLCQQFEKRTVDKTYLTLVDGNFLQKEGVIDRPIAENMARRGKMIVAKRGKASITEYKVVEEFQRFSLVEANIKTGRTHQVRVHFEALGHPLAVDALYGRREGLKLSEIKGKKYKMGKFTEEERPLMSRTTLHAHRLSFKDPVTGEVRAFVSELPKDFKAVLKQLRKWGK